MKKACFIHSAEIEKYHYPPDSPFKLERAAAMYRMCSSLGLLRADRTEIVAPTKALAAEVRTFHTKKYLQVLNNAAGGILEAEGLFMGLGRPETPVFRDMVEYALFACGATLTGARRILSGANEIVFNPSGGFHHAQAEKAAGFCYLNDIVVAALELTAVGQRVLYLDIDAHHGDGVQNAFYDRPEVMAIMLHESGKTLFPGTGFERELGTGKGKGYNVNIPLPAHIYDDAYRQVYTTLVPPLAAAYNPDLIILEAGMDILAGDPLTNIRLTNNVVADIAHHLVSLKRPVLALGGGGYHIDNTVRGWTLLWSILTGQDIQEEMSFGLGGVMMESTDWQGGLRDRELVVNPKVRKEIKPAIDQTIELVKKHIFPLHGI